MISYYCIECSFKFCNFLCIVEPFEDKKQIFEAINYKEKKISKSKKSKSKQKTSTTNPFKQVQVYKDLLETFEKEKKEKKRTVNTQI